MSVLDDILFQGPTVVKKLLTKASHEFWGPVLVPIATFVCSITQFAAWVSHVSEGRIRTLAPQTVKVGLRLVE